MELIVRVFYLLLAKHYTSIKEPDLPEKSTTNKLSSFKLLIDLSRFRENKDQLLKATSLSRNYLTLEYEKTTNRHTTFKYYS